MTKPYGGITKKPKPQEGEFSTPRIYCSSCMERMTLERWNARSRVAVVVPCECRETLAKPEVDGPIEPLDCWVRRQQEGGAA